MLNSEPIETGPNTEDTPVPSTPSEDTSPGGSTGAIALASLATLIVVAIWFTFYLLIFVPRAGAP
jgi:hypothetical protein